uniref:Putative ovule protein n=1 Tax=Solanum chacoense TaxID=4108 RepID=A0A0V0H650_SOLCH
MLDSGGIGGVFRNTDGHWILGYCMHIPYTTITEAELKGLFHGLCLAILTNLSPIQVEIDIKEVITLLSSSNAKYANILLDCRSTLRQVCETLVTHIYREQNQVADSLSNHGATMEL